MKKLFTLIVFMLSFSAWSQTKVEGIVVDENDNPIAFANVMFKNSTEGTITNDNGRFYLESDTRYKVLVVSLLGYTPQEIELTKSINYNLSVTLVEGEQLDEVVLYVGKQSKKNNPAVEILKKIWAKKRENGLYKFDQYAYDKYEKIEFDLNTIDSSVIKSKLFKGMEFIFDHTDTSSVTGKTYLPMFINESFYKVYGDNKLKKEKEELLGNKNSGFNTNQTIIAYVNDLYSEYNIYDNYLQLFDKSFVSPLSKTGVDTYNYVLADSAYLGNKWCYKIIYYPRRKNELTFKGQFWVNDTTYAVKEIDMQATKSANINWVKEMYIEQEYEVVNDSVFLLKRDYMLTDFSINKKEKSRGVYGRRTTVYDNHVFDDEKPKSFYDKKIDPFNPLVYDRADEFWENNRLEVLNEDEKGIYKMLDTLTTVPKFKQLYKAAEVLASGYFEFDKLNFDYGPLYSTYGYNPAEGIRVRVGGRTYKTANDQFRLQGYTAYGLNDRKFKYGISAKWLIDRKNRIILSAGTRRDVEQIGVNLTNTNDVLGRSFASSALFTAGANDKLTNINLTTAGLEFEIFKNLKLRGGSSFRTMRSALPEDFSLSYIDLDAPEGVSDVTRQFETYLTLDYQPGRETIGYGVERRDQNDDYAHLFVNYSLGVKGILDSDFNYEKVQFYYRKPWMIGGFGRLQTIFEAGKVFGEVPLSLLDVVPGNQTYFSIFNTFPNLNFYEFVTDTYTSVHLEHNFNGRIFSRIPLLRDLNLRELVGVRGVWGDLSEENKLLNAPANIPLIAPNDKIYWEYSFGVGNIFKVFRIDFNFRGNYFDLPDARRFSVTGSFGFEF
ncbi:DUF5686 and carboxypeptidase-like regulatory domain-containing protein [Zhouia amylolytica]|nr:DUF5686 and carboxypeptidase-like regulatory domain-containing protein [Zhouia amylolytica]MCQ0110629.1 carboxypeptidase-like regulatory domain-containing protein [Zhouia amylolytica]